MQSQDDAQLLKAIESQLRTDDPRFCNAMQAWRPCPPREYRRSCPRLILLASLVMLALALAVVAGITLSHA